MAEPTPSPASTCCSSCSSSPSGRTLWVWALSWTSWAQVLLIAGADLLMAGIQSHYMLLWSSCSVCDLLDSQPWQSSFLLPPCTSLVSHMITGGPLKVSYLHKPSAIIICTENINSVKLLQKISAIIICTEDLISAQSLQNISEITISIDIFLFFSV